MYYVVVPAKSDSETFPTDVNCFSKSINPRLKSSPCNGRTYKFSFFALISCTLGKFFSLAMSKSALSLTVSTNSFSVAEIAHACFLKSSFGGSEVWIAQASLWESSGVIAAGV